MPPSARNNKHCTSAYVNCSIRKKRYSGTGPTCPSCAARGLKCDWKADRRRVQAKNAGVDCLGSDIGETAFALPCAHIGPAPAFYSNAGDQFLHPNEALAPVSNIQPDSQLVGEDIASAANFVWVEPPRWSGAVCTPVNAFGLAIPPLFTGSSVLR
ncbi:hypothetical protein AURDEDRAFT_165670 [Auricularia subglabra TFB-10046 SS5]|nr:hypothetical protein AURDEDRAFT_165670 [Auricularia subglabra TFB-10046 SS5]